MKFGWLVPHNTISIIPQEVCQVILDEYMDEVFQQHPMNREKLLMASTRNGIFQTHVGRLMGNTLRANALQTVARPTIIT